MNSCGSSLEMKKGRFAPGTGKGWKPDRSANGLEIGPIGPVLRFNSGGLTGWSHICSGTGRGVCGEALLMLTRRAWMRAGSCAGGR